MRYFLLILLCLTAGGGISQSTLDSEEATEPASSAAELELNSRLESLVLDYELARTSSFNQGKKIISAESFAEMASISEQVNELNPNSYASEYLQFKQDGFTEAGLSHLKNAETKTLNKTELLSDFLAISHILKKNDLLETYAVQLRNSGFIESATLEYNKNVLRSFTESNAVLITNGWEDTYPLLTLLKQEGKRTINVVNMEWLYDKSYRTSLAKSLGKSAVAFTNPYQWISQMTTGSSLPIYYTPTIPNSELVKLQSELTPVGLVFKRGELTAEVQKQYNLSAWKKFSKLAISSSNPLSKNYIIMLTMLEQQLMTDALEKGTLTQVSATKKALVKKHSSLN